ncbi:MAG: hypothetical protein RI935_19 [Candidatus Parcubacteria bacterium]|jgi:NADPH:quinone reductase-like Zn-dependent oxidoreductase
MKAVIVEKYGGPEVAQVKNIEEPIITKPNQLRIKIIAAGVNSGDARLRRADPWFVRLVFGFMGPRKRILGANFSGIVEEIGANVSTYTVGDRVYGMTENFVGCHAEYLVINNTTPMGKIPEKMSYVDAAALPFGFTTALHFLEGVDLANKTVFINGASGAVGVSFLQLSKDRGALVTAVTSTDNVELMTQLGADMVFDYTKTDILSLGIKYDVVIDCVNVIPVKSIHLLTKEGGVIILLSGLIKEMLQSLFIKKYKVIIGTARVTSEQFLIISSLYTKGVIHPVINKTFTIDEVAKAYQLVDSKKKVGNVVLKIQEE